MEEGQRIALSLLPGSTRVISSCCSCLHFPKDSIFKWEKELWVLPRTGLACQRVTGLFFFGCYWEDRLWGRSLPFFQVAGVLNKRPHFFFSKPLPLELAYGWQWYQPNPTFCSIILSCLFDLGEKNKVKCFLTKKIPRFPLADWSNMSTGFG